MDDAKCLRSEYRNLPELENDLEVVGEAQNGFWWVIMVKTLRPAFVLMEIVMPRQLRRIGAIIVKSGIPYGLESNLNRAGFGGSAVSQPTKSLITLLPVVWLN